MIGQSVINVKSGGRSRLSTLVAGVALLLMVVFLSDWVGRIPMAALVAVMIMVSIGTFRWESIRNLKRYPLSTNLVMLVTVGVVLATHNLAFGVVAGVLLASLFFANKIGHYLDIDSERLRRRHPPPLPGERAGVLRVVRQVHRRLRPERDAGACAHRPAPRPPVGRHRRRGTGQGDPGLSPARRAGRLGLNAASATLVDRFGAYDKPGAVDILPGH